MKTNYKSANNYSKRIVYQGIIIIVVKDANHNSLVQLQHMTLMPYWNIYSFWSIPNQ